MPTDLNTEGQTDQTPVLVGSGSSWPADYADYSAADYDLDNGPQS